MINLNKLQTIWTNALTNLPKEYTAEPSQEVLEIQLPSLSMTSQTQYVELVLSTECSKDITATLTPISGKGEGSIGYSAAALCIYGEGTIVIKVALRDRLSNETLPLRHNPFQIQVKTKDW